MIKAVFLDRDGVINYDYSCVYRVSDFTFIPGVFEALKLLNDAGYKLFVITNQSGIGRGVYTEEDVEKLHAHMLAQFKEHGINVEKIYYCPHTRDDCCDCRKPNPSSILDAQKKFDINLDESYFVGDRNTDIECGDNAGVKTVLVGNTDTEPCNPDYREKDLLSAVTNIILADGKN